MSEFVAKAASHPLELNARVFQLHDFLARSFKSEDTQRRTKMNQGGTWSRKGGFKLASQHMGNEEAFFLIAGSGRTEASSQTQTGTVSEAPQK